MQLTKVCRVVLLHFASHATQSDPVYSGLADFKLASSNLIYPQASDRLLEDDPLEEFFCIKIKDRSTRSSQQEMQQFIKHLTTEVMSSKKHEIMRQKTKQENRAGQISSLQARQVTQTQEITSNKEGVAFVSSKVIKTKEKSPIKGILKNPNEISESKLTKQAELTIRVPAQSCRYSLNSTVITHSKSLKKISHPVLDINLSQLADEKQPKTSRPDYRRLKIRQNQLKRDEPGLRVTSRLSKEQSKSRQKSRLKYSRRIQNNWQGAAPKSFQHQQLRRSKCRVQKLLKKNTGKS